MSFISIGKFNRSLAAKTGHSTHQYRTDPISLTAGQLANAIRKLFFMRICLLYSLEKRKLFLFLSTEVDKNSLLKMLNLFPVKVYLRNI